VEPAAEDPGTWSCAADMLAPGRTAKFRLSRRGKTVEGFIVNVKGSYHAYVNRCPHAGTSLDLWPNEFLTEDGRYLICSTHGAIFEQDTGLCVEGPCPGARLETLAVELDGASLVVRCPT
jgi:nitrite reductase/ring-hydroxylating ferredoxin subunit